MTKTYYKVDRLWEDTSNPGNWHYYRSHTFDTYEEVTKYIQTHNRLYRLVITRIEETAVETIEPTYEHTSSENYEKFLGGFEE
jgi:hypothetical protein